MMDVVAVGAAKWSARSVVYSTSPFHRWRGLRSARVETSLLMKTRSVHGIGMPSAFVAVALDREMKVIGSRVVEPGTVAWFRRARFILELPPDMEPPPLDSRLELRHV
jgi:hypothetical protein